MAMQGNGKVRLIAKQGRYREDGVSTRLRELVAAGADPNILSDANRANEFLYGEGIKKEDILSNYYIEFDVTPEITESASASYFEAGEIRGPGSILFYMGSPARTFTLNAKLVARNRPEAVKVDKQIHILKSWRQPESYTGGISAGVPTLLYLQGYGKMFKDIPVVMTDLSIELSSEHDYLKTTENLNGVNGGAAVPIITPVSITLKEARSTEGDLEGLETFDILKYRTGSLAGW